jgi:fructose-1,6-bisphosphatase/inositol monophosphatase family enzyme
MTSPRTGFMGVDPAAVEALLCRAAAEIVLPRFEALRAHEIIEKRPGDVVTVADLEAEHFLTKELPNVLPGSLVVGEEAHSKEPEILRRFDGDSPVWLVDPVDGTRNFTKGDPMFCMMVALVVRNRPIGAWIHDPLGGWTVVAEEGAGAWLNGARMTVPEAPPVDRWIGMVNSWYFEEPRRARLRAETKARFGRIRSLSCAGHDLVAQARGERHFSFYRRLWPWDHAPGALILREAGGAADTVEGTPYRAGDRVHGFLTAPSEAHWRELRAWLLGKGGRVNPEEGPPGPE